MSEIKLPDGYVDVMHVVAEVLVDHFRKEGAVNYIEQTFTDKDDETESFTLTMQRTNGLTPCEKPDKAQKRVDELEDRLNAHKVELCKRANQLCKIRDVVSSFNGGLTPIGCDGKILLTVEEYNSLVNSINGE